VKAVFADTFYWAALTSTEDSSHVRALEFSRSAQLDRIVTTDEVLVEYLAFFASARPSVRMQAGNTVAQFLAHSRVQVIPQTRDSFLASSEEFVGDGERQRAVSLRNRWNFRQVESNDLCSSSPP
jgi:uncharacterized protein